MRKVEGFCKPTGAYGRLVRSHLLPRAVTRPRVAGRPFLQGGDGSRLTQRWDSWYDQDLVPDEGEQILARYDTLGIRELTRLRLIWKSWGSRTALPYPVTIEPGFPSFGLRIVRCSDNTTLRLFFLTRSVGESGPHRGA